MNWQMDPLGHDLPGKTEYEHRGLGFPDRTIPWSTKLVPNLGKSRGPRVVRPHSTRKPSGSPARLSDFPVGGCPYGYRSPPVLMGAWFMRAGPPGRVKL